MLDKQLESSRVSVKASSGSQYGLRKCSQVPRHVALAEVRDFVLKTAKSWVMLRQLTVPIKALGAAFTVSFIAVEAAVLEVASWTCVLGEVLLTSA